MDDGLRSELKAALPSPSTPPESEVQLVQKQQGLDGEWLSPDHYYAFRLTGNEGLATLSNSSKYKPGHNLLRADSVYGTSFRGRQMFTDGELVPVVGRLISANELEMSGKGITWIMVRVAPGSLMPFQGGWYSPDHRYGFLFKGAEGKCTQSNSEQYRVGQTMIQIGSADGKTFYGRQLFTDGEYHNISGRLNGEGEIEMSSDGTKWKMVRR